MQEQLNYQLRLMALVNIGTNMHVPSARITSIDPRGGAAVLGDNGVGKTTTLRILPLFFGHLASQLVATGQGQEPMVGFVLPTDASAIAFEYQRGSEAEEDLRLAVIRRRSDEPDVPFYRLYRCGFRKDLFVDAGRFLSDEETQKKANELGIQSTKKLSTSEYRSVILRTQAMSKDKDLLRRYSLEWSFGPKQLDNLDRLVAAMVKKHINFADIVQVAVGLVQQEIGHGSERAKLTFKQGKGPIEHWLKNREACVSAFKLAPQIGELEDDLKEHRAAEAKMRSRRADVAAVTAARVSEKTAVAGAIEAMTTARADTVNAQAAARAGLAQAASQASAAAVAAKNAYEEQAGLAAFYEGQRAAFWETQVQDLPSKRLEKKTLDTQVALAEEQHKEATAKYAAMAQDARTATATRQRELEQEKQPHRERLATTREQIGAAEDAARNEAVVLQDARLGELEEAREPLLGQRGIWETRKATPTATPEALQELQQTGERLQKHTEDLGQVQGVLSRQLAAQDAARRAFDEHEQAIRVAKTAVETASGEAGAARLLLDPNPGSLLAALRAHGDDSWKRNLAKVIHPALLERDDLEPVRLEDAAETLYGWGLSTGVIAAPDWVDDELARKKIAEAEARLNAAQAHLRSLQEASAGKSRILKEAEQAVNIAQARVGVLQEQSETLKTALATAKHLVETQERSAVATATVELERLKGELDANKTQQGAIRAEHARTLAAVKAANDTLRSEAQRLHDAAIAAIDTSIARLDAELKVTLEGIDEQLKEHLSAAGVDVERLKGLKDRAAALKKDIDEREEKESMVGRWRTWIAEGGTSRVEALKAAAEQAQALAGQHTGALADFDAKAAQATRAYETALNEKNKRLSDIEDDLKVLEDLDAEFGDYQATGVSVINVATTVKELRGQVRDARAELSRAERSVTTRFSTLRQALTAKDNAVKELVEASLGTVAAGSEIQRASQLCNCFKLIGPQVANDVNLTLKTLLVNISAFQKAIQSFEKEVGAFNNRLQAGLSAVRCFERIKDLRLSIVTNFENLGFYKKLSRMDAIVRAHSDEVGKDFTRDLPPDETARALQDFVSVLGSDGSVEVNLSSHITLTGSVTDNGQRKEFKRAGELENVSSEGLTNLILITLMTALLNTIRGSEPVHVPWVTDEVGRFDPTNFLALMRMLRDNRIDVVTASPELGPAQQDFFARRYYFEDKGRIRLYTQKDARAATAPATVEVLS